MKKLVLTLLLIPLISLNSAFANPLAIRLNKDQISPYSGILLNEEMAKVIYDQLDDCGRIKLINKSLNDSIEIYKKNEVLYKSEVTLIRNENLTLRTALDKSNENNFWRNALYFGLGVLSTSAVVYATRH